MTEHPSSLQLHGVPYQDEDLIRFSAGIPGFEALRKFLLVSIPEHDPFVWLYSAENTQIRFILINPLLFRPDYAPKITKDQLADLQIDAKEDLRLYVIVTMQPDTRNSTANLAGPILVNIKRKLAKQIIIDDAKYGVRESLLAGEG